jgi:hypothetical protein
MLESALLMLRMVLYVIKLLYISKNGGAALSPAGSTSGVSFGGGIAGGVGGGGGVVVVLKDNIKRAVLRLWDEAQQASIMRYLHMMSYLT